jgi:hypothetical protein
VKRREPRQCGGQRGTWRQRVEESPRRDVQREV